MSEFQKQIDSDEDKTPRGAVKFLATSASMAIVSLKNPGRRRGAAEAIRLALVQAEAELTRLYAIERTARHFVTEYDLSASKTKETDETRSALKESLDVQVPQ